MNMYKYVRNLWKNPKKSLGDLWSQRLIAWRNEPATIRIEHPTRIDRARNLGYKAKQGYFIVRQKVLRGTHVHEKDDHRKRRPKHRKKRMDLDKSYQWIAEDRANKKYPNCEVLNSYWVASDGKHHWFEIIFVDKSHPVILKDNNIKWIANQHGRTARGLTSAAKLTRGLSNKGKGAEKIR